MSLRALLWALHDSPCEDPVAKLVLIVLADYAHDDGTAAFPSVSTIAATVPCDRATVHRHLRRLRESGLLVRGDQQLVAHMRSDRRPVVYDLRLERTVSGVASCDPVPPNGVAHGVAERAPATLNGVAHGVALVRHNPRENQEPNPTPARAKSREQLATDSMFDRAMSRAQSRQNGRPT